MIISMKMHATRQEIDEVRAQVAHFGYKVHSIEGEERVVIGVVGVGDVTACLESVESMPQVEKVMRISAPYKFVSKQFYHTTHRLHAPVFVPRPPTPLTTRTRTSMRKITSRLTMVLTARTRT